MDNLKDKVIVVTGAGGNIGRAYCEGFVEEGARVVAADLGDLSDFAEQLGGASKAIAVKVDVTDAASTEQMVGSALAAYGRIDGLVNNAGFFKSATFGSFMNIPAEEWDLCYRVNVRGVWQCCKAVYPHMKERGSGRIVNISSNTPYKGVPNFLHYVSSKAAIIGLSRSLAREVGPYGITVNSLCPDLIPDDDIIAKQGTAADERIVSARCIARTQLPKDMVGAAVFLLSGQSDFVTGQSLLVNGGAFFN